MATRQKSTAANRSATGTIVRRPAKKKLTRVEKSEHTREELFRAAIKIVGKYGYAGASIARITAQAKVAQGTFYNYFASRQDILEEILPFLGGEMLEFINLADDRKLSDVEREVRRFEAFFKFIDQQPEFFRIFNEAEQAVPNGYRRHIANVAEGYKRLLGNANGRGSLKDFSVEEIEVISYILMGIRAYLRAHFGRARGGIKPIPPVVKEVYSKIIRAGIFK